MHYVTAGSGSKALILVHGGPAANAPNLLATFEPLTASGYTVVYYDQRGVGSSPAPTDGDYSPDAYVADLEALRQRLGADTLDLIGHSWGGFVAALYAAAHPDRVRSVVEVAGLPLDPNAAQQGQTSFSRRVDELQIAHVLPTPLPSSAGDDCTAALRALAPVYAPHAAQAEQYLDAFEEGGACSVAVGEHAQAAAVAGQPRVAYLAAALRRWNGKALIVMGALDPFGTDWATADAAQYPAARVSTIIVPGVGHFPWLDDPGVVARIVRELAS